MGQDPDQIRNEIEETRERMGETVEALGHKADVPGRVKENLADKRDRLKAQMSGTSSKVSESTPDVDVTGSAKKAAGIAQENPLGLALGGVALGFLAGLALPTTRVEDEKIGPMADTLKEQVKETAQTAVEHGKEAAQEAAQAATQAAKETGQQHAQDAKSDLQDQAQQAKDEVASSAPTSGSSGSAGSSSYRTY